MSLYAFNLLKRRIPGLVFPGVILWAACGSGLAFAAAVYQASVSEYTLKNGMKLIVKEDRRAPVVVSQLWYRIGASYERPGVTGISHALEHMMFKGTPRYPGNEFSRIISINGGEDNAFTSKDYTVYFQKLERSRLPVSLELEADRMVNVEVSEQKFLKEIEVIKEERRLRVEDNPQSYTYEQLISSAFADSPYRHPTVGWMSDLESMQAQDLREWYRRWYAPNNATLVIAGDVDPAQVRQWVEQYFDHIPAASVPEAAAEDSGANATPRQNDTRRLKVRRPAQLPFLLMAYPFPSQVSAERDETVARWEPDALAVLLYVLDGGSSSRLQSHLVRGQQVASSVNSSYRAASRLDTLCIFSAVPAEGKTVAELEQALRAELEQMRTELLDAEELQRAKNQMIAAEIFQRDSIFGQALLIGTLESIGLSWRLLDEYPERLERISAEQVREVARKYLVDERLTVAELIPQPIPEGTRPPRSPPPGGPGRVH